MNSARRVLIAVSAIVATCGLASATSLPETFTLTVNLGDYDTTNYGGLLNVQGFDPTLGTLNDLTIQINTSINSSITASTTSSSPQSGNVKTELGIAFDDSAITFDQAAFTFVSAGNFNSLFGSTNIPEIDKNTSTFTFNVVSPGTPSQSSGPLTASSNFSSGIITNGVILSEFTTAGVYSGLNFITAAQTVSGTSGNVNFSQVTTATLTGTVTYDYTPFPPPGTAPEPTTLFLMGSALVGVGLIRKRIVRK